MLGLERMVMKGACSIMLKEYEMKVERCCDKKGHSTICLLSKYEVKRIRTFVLFYL